MEFEASIEIAAADRAGGTSWSTWSGGQRTESVWSIELLDGGRLAVGSRVRINQPRFPAATWTVTELDPGRSFSWVNHSPGLHSEGSHAVTEQAGASVAHDAVAERPAGAADRPPLRWSQSSLRDDGVGGVAAAGRGVGRVTFEFGPDLRERLRRNLARHERWEVPVGDLRHAAVAVVVLDSDADAHGDDPSPFGPDEMAAVPGTEGLELDGSVAGTAGGPAVLLTQDGAASVAFCPMGGRVGRLADPGERAGRTALRRELHESPARPPGVAPLGASTTTPRGPAKQSPASSPWGGADPRNPQPGPRCCLFTAPLASCAGPNSPRRSCRSP